MEWGRAGTGEAEEGHTASYRHWLADPALVMWLKSELELTETMMFGFWSHGGQVSQDLIEGGLEDNQNNLSSS